jgi:hypothetical protein
MHSLKQKAVADRTPSVLIAYSPKLLPSFSWFIISKSFEMIIICKEYFDIFFKVI